MGQSKRVINEDVAELTSGIHNLAERVGYLYSEVERRHRFRFLFDPLRMLGETAFIKSYVAGENPFPKSVEIDPSNACNHDCTFCIYHSMHSKERSERLDAEVLLRVVDELGALGCASILFVGGGEPMTNRCTVDAIERAASLGISAGLVTNGSLVKGDAQLRLKRAATYVRFSLDAANPETHLRLHRNDDHHRIMRNLRDLAAAEGRCTVGTGFFINEDNVTEIVECAALVKESGADYIQFKCYSGIEIDRALHERILLAVEQVLPLADEGFDIHVADRIFENVAYQVRGYTKCHWQAFKPIINADGSVFLCAQKRTNRNAIIGNVHTASLREIWDSEERRAVVRELKLVDCPYCVHHKQNQMIEFFSSFQAPHRSFF